MLRDTSRSRWLRLSLSTLIVTTLLLAKPLLAQQSDGDWLRFRIRGAVNVESASSRGSPSGSAGYWQVLAEIVVAWDRLLFPPSIAYAQAIDTGSARDTDPEDDLEAASTNSSEDTGVRASDAATRAKPEGSGAGDSSSARGVDSASGSRAPPSTAISPPASSAGAPSGTAGASPGEARDRDRWVVTSAFAQRAVEAALSQFAMESRPALLDSMAARAKSSALLPQMRFQVRRSTDESLRLTPTATDPNRYTLAGGADLWLEGRVTWQLDRLIFAKEEVALWRLRQDVEKAKSKRVELVIEELYHWQKATLRASDPLTEPEEQLLAILERTRAAALLDALTAGWFSAQLERRQKPAQARDPSSPQP